MFPQFSAWGDAFAKRDRALFRAKSENNTTVQIEQSFDTNAENYNVMTVAALGGNKL